MERLTKVMNCDDGNKLYDYSNEVIRECKDFSSRLELMFEKLAEYEDLEEQGLLLRLPCKIGDVIWDIDYGVPTAYEITGYSFGEADDYIDEPIITDGIVCYYSNSNGSITGSFAVSEIGKTVFLTKAEAEQKLKERDRVIVW